MKRTLFKLAIVCLLAAGFLFAVSCGRDPAGDPDETTVDPGALIAGKSGSVFSIVYPVRWSDLEMNAAQDLQSALSKSYASVPKLIDDGKAATDYEILIGNTNRPESASALEGLNDYGWAITVSGNKIVLNAKLGTFLSDAVEYFIRTYVGSAEQIGINNVSEHIDNSEKYSQPYVIAVGNRSAYTVCYPSSGSGYLKASARTFSEKLLKEQGVSIAVQSGKPSSGKAITLSDDSTVEGWKIVYEENGDISILGKTEALAVCALNTFQTEFLKKDTEGDILMKDPKPVSSDAGDYARSGWLLAAPAYEGGTLASRLYDCGAGMLDSGSSYMMCVSGTTAAQFYNYLEKLSACGYTMDSENTVPSSTGKSNLFAGYRKGTQYLWVYYLAETGEVRVIEDRISTPESEFEYTFDYDNNTATEVYLYGMKYHPQGSGYGEEGGDPNSCNNGTFIIIKQADGSVFLIDGGFYVQATPAAINGLWQFLHEITGKSANEKIVISCWFVTHPHGDHYALVSSLIEIYRDQLDLQRVMFNFPTASEVGNNMGIEGKIRGAASRYFPNAQFAKCHTGQSIRLGSMTIDVLTTHEDAVSATTGKTTITEGNSMTSVLRFTFADGTRYMELGDFTEEREAALLKMYQAAEFRCEISDVAHHGFNRVRTLYNRIAARYILWSNYPADDWSTATESGRWRKVVSEHNLTYVRESNPNVEVYYAGLNTAKLECKHGEVTVTLTDPVY